MNEEKIEQIEADMFSFIQAMRLLSKENDRLARKLESFQRENKTLSEIVANHAQAFD